MARSDTPSLTAARRATAPPPPPAATTATTWLFLVALLASGAVLSQSLADTQRMRQLPWLSITIAGLALNMVEDGRHVNASSEFIHHINAKNCKIAACFVVIGFVVYHGIIHLTYGTDTSARVCLCCSRSDLRRLCVTVMGVVISFGALLGSAQGLQFV